MRHLQEYIPLHVPVQVVQVEQLGQLSIVSECFQLQLDRLELGGRAGKEGESWSTLFISHTLKWHALVYVDKYNKLHSPHPRNSQNKPKKLRTPQPPESPQRPEALRLEDPHHPLAFSPQPLLAGRGVVEDPLFHSHRLLRGRQFPGEALAASRQARVEDRLQVHGGPRSARAEPAGGDVVAGGGADGEGRGGGKGIPQRREHVQEGAGA